MNHLPISMLDAFVRLIGAIWFLAMIAATTPTRSAAQQLWLSDRLAEETLASLAADAQQRGDAARGASTFYRPELSCAKCHEAATSGRRLGPDLAERRDVTGEKLAESILFPSREIREGYETTLVLLADGRQLSGIVVEEDAEAIQLDRIEEIDKPLTILKSDIEERRNATNSTMPDGLVNHLADRGEFLDLIRYLKEIAEGGAARAAQLRPMTLLSSQAPLPEYEARVDHRGLIESMDEWGLSAGEQIYRLRCASCHGTSEFEGSMPTALRFSVGRFKRGSDPYSMYQTLTNGYGMMAPQRWMVPQQKYAVIHYIRETFLRDHNPSQWFPLSEEYLSQLPAGDTLGPRPVESTPWTMMDYGPSMFNTIEVSNDGSNIAQKGIAIRLDDGPGGVESGSYWMLYDHDTLRVAAGWSGAFIDYNGIHFNGVHGLHPRVTGKVLFQNPSGPGWGRPGNGSFRDERLLGRDQKHYGPLPRDWAQYRGMYRFGKQTILNYTVGSVEILEMPALRFAGDLPVFMRIFDIGPRGEELTLQVARHGAKWASRDGLMLASNTTNGERQTNGLLVTGRTEQGQISPADWLTSESGDLRLRIPVGQERLQLHIFLAPLDDAKTLDHLARELSEWGAPASLIPFTRGGPAQWPQVLETDLAMGEDRSAFAVDVLEHPVENPWSDRLRLTGLDFAPGEDAAYVCTWDGTVWKVSGIGQTEPGSKLRWRRIAAGLFQPLGIKLRDGVIFVTCRDQLVALHDLNGNGEVDWYQCYNNDHQVTEHFHEFAMGLQIDEEGNFYYAKSARHALPALVPHHGTLLKISADGQSTEIVATGFRAANGVCLNGDGTLVVTDQEGHWMPKNRINWVKPGGFYGNMYGYHNVTDASDNAMEPPLCWITNSFDRSPAELVWVDSDHWGPLNGALLSFSYGYGRIYLVPHENVGGQMQGGMVALDIPQFPTGIMRGRFSPRDGQLYCCGMFAWSGTQEQPGGLYRVRYTGKPTGLPIGLRAYPWGIELAFAEPLDAHSASDLRNYAVQAWDLKRSAQYGSDHINQRSWSIESAELMPDGKTIRLRIPDIAPTWGMEIVYAIASANGTPINGKIHNTIHRMR